MAGHSKWAQIKHKKAVVDARRGSTSPSSRARSRWRRARAGATPTATPALAPAIQKARDASMPKDNIERAIAKGTGAGGDADAIESVLYEGYGPGGVALLIEALTDNRNRTGAEVRHALTKHGGSLGEPGSVAYLFDKKGVIVVDAARYSEDDLIPAIDAGAEDIALDDDVYEILTEPGDLAAVRDALERGRASRSSPPRWSSGPRRGSRSTRTTAAAVRLIDALEENDDVNAVHANFDVAADVLERVMAG